MKTPSTAPGSGVSQGITESYIRRRSAMFTSKKKRRATIYEQAGLPQIPDWMAASLFIEERAYRPIQFFSDQEEYRFNQALAICVTAMREWKRSLELDPPTNPLAGWDWRAFHSKNFKQVEAE